MYLLKPAWNILMSGRSVFTFHHVSIKTVTSSTPAPSLLVFTFHHVSIKTDSQNQIEFHHEHSHSTMYLLKPCISTFNV